MKQFLLVWLIFFGTSPQGLVGLRWLCKDITSNTPLMRLKLYLFCNYDEEIRPTENYRNATVVSFELEVEHFDVDEMANTIDLHVGTRLVWIDPHLTWEPSQFGDIESIHVLSSEVWVPDITLHSATNQYVDVNIPTVTCNLGHKGDLLCLPLTVYTTYCESDHTWWPYDVMNCSLHVAPWSYNNDEMDVRPWNVYEGGRLMNEAYGSNTQWDIVNILFSEHVIDSKFGLGFSSKLLSYHIILKRHSSVYAAIYVTMAVVLMMMTLMVLWLEPSSTERMILAILNFILHFLSLQEIQWKIPSNGTHPPRLLIFYENSFILATFSLILTSILRHVQQLKIDAPMWISSTSVLILKSRIGQIFLMSILDPNVSARIELSADDNTNLVSSNKRDHTWKYTSILIGWLAFLSILFAYIIILAVFLPTSTLSNFPVVKS